MDEQIKQIGERLRGLREVLDIPVEEIAALCEITQEHYLEIEEGKADPSIFRLSKIARHYGIDLDVLLFGEEPRMKGYFVTRKGKGLTVERRKEYKYQSLGAGFRGRRFESFLTQVDPVDKDVILHKNSHAGQEFDYVIEGTLELTIGDKVMVLEEGDSIIFDANHPHCMKALGGQPVKFLVIVD